MHFESRAEGVKLGQIAVVFRFKAAMEALEEALRVHDIAFQSLRTLKPRDLRWGDDAVRILTAHSVKGLEFSHEFVGAILEHRVDRIARRLQARPRTGHGRYYDMEVNTWTRCLPAGGVPRVTSFGAAETIRSQSSWAAGDSDRLSRRISDTLLVYAGASIALNASFSVIVDSAAKYGSTVTQAPASRSGTSAAKLSTWMVG
nr:hypothetical protein [Variovorax sp. E3]